MGFDLNDFNDLVASMGGIGVVIGMLLAFIIVYTICLKLAIKWTGGNKTGFGTVFVTALISVILGNALPCLGCFLSAYIISLRHEQKYGKALLAFIIAELIPLVVVIIIIIIMVGGIAAILAIFDAAMIL